MGLFTISLLVILSACMPHAMAEDEETVTAAATYAAAWIPAMAENTGVDATALATIADMYILSLCEDDTRAGSPCEIDGYNRRFAVAYAQYVARVMCASNNAAARRYPPASEVALAYMLYAYAEDKPLLLRIINGPDFDAGGINSVMTVIHEATKTNAQSGWLSGRCDGSSVVSRLWATCAVHASICEKLPSVNEIIKDAWSRMQRAAELARL
jgi:hypothetical protein